MRISPLLLSAIAGITASKSIFRGEGSVWLGKIPNQALRLAKTCKLKTGIVDRLRNDQQDEIYGDED
jgi:hypothetical protein